MSKADVLAELQDDFENPGSQKSGEYLEEHVLATAYRALILGDRQALVEVLRDWISTRRAPQSRLAVTIARKLSLIELRQDIQGLRADVERGRAHDYDRFALRWIDAALQVLHPPDK